MIHQVNFLFFVGEHDPLGALTIKLCEVRLVPGRDNAVAFEATEDLKRPRGCWDLLAACSVNVIFVGFQVVQEGRCTGSPEFI